MAYTLRVNDEHIYYLREWNASSFSCDHQLILLTTEFSKVRDELADIKKIEIYDNLVSVYVSTLFDTFSDFALLKSAYVNNEGMVSDCLRVSLSLKTDIVDRISSLLDDKANPIIDISKMTIEDLKKYILKQVGTACQDDIFAGMSIPLSDGLKYFTFNLEDQQNLTTAMATVKACATAGIGVPYHASGEKCKLFPVPDILTIYFTLQLMLTRKTTYCNMLNIHIRSLNTREELMECCYGMDLPEDLQNDFNEIVAASMVIVNTNLAEYMPPTQPEEPEDPEEPIENPGDLSDPEEEETPPETEPEE
ncbi:MAG: hypothetical protein PHC62_00310 [Candidatus Izemoplasmatales bacterium]|nr:hypothetical protein [Candidatus Izemoplasmatales bacterium]